MILKNFSLQKTSVFRQSMKRE